MKQAVGLGLLLATSILVGACGGQELKTKEASTPVPVKRTIVAETELEGIEGKVMRAWVAEFAPGANTGKHYHPLHVFVYVLEGDFTIEVQGEPAVTLKPGEIIDLEPKQVHEAKNLLNSPTKVLAFGLATKGESIVLPVK